MKTEHSDNDCLCFFRIISCSIFWQATVEVNLVNLEKDDQWLEDARDFLDKLLLIGTNKNLVPPRQPQEFSRVVFESGEGTYFVTSLFMSHILF